MASFASSYIPTQASQVTRAADQVSILTSAFGYNAAEGTLFAEAYGPPSAGGGLQLDDGTVNNRPAVLYTFSTTSVFMAALTAGSPVLNTSLGGIAEGALYAAAMGYRLDDYAGALDGGSVVTDLSATVAAATTLRVGSNVTSAYANSHIKRIAYFPTRKSNAELQELTS